MSMPVYWAVCKGGPNNTHPEMVRCVLFPSEKEARSYITRMVEADALSTKTLGDDVAPATKWELWSERMIMSRERIEL